MKKIKKQKKYGVTLVSICVASIVVCYIIYQCGLAFGLYITDLIVAEQDNHFDIMYKNISELKSVHDEIDSVQVEISQKKRLSTQ